MKIKVIGCGVSGLTTALHLSKAGHEVEIITEKLPQETTSAKAAAIWFPYAVHPKEKVNRWSRRSYNKFRKLCLVKDSGVSMISLIALIERKEDAWWLKALPDDQVREAFKSEVPAGYEMGYVLKVPLIETPIYLDYLLKSFRSLNGKILLEKVDSLSTYSNEMPVVNCSGLASRELAQDPKVYPVYGQIVKVENQQSTRCISAEYNPFGKEDELAYVIPRADCTILGGTAIKGRETIQPDGDLTRGIIKRCVEIAPELADVKVQSVVAGLRPGRTEIRLERQGNIIHNYGHGGGGFTVSWGCAEEVLQLIDKVSNPLLK